MRTLQLWILAAVSALVGCSRPVPEPAPVDAGHVASAPLPPARDGGNLAPEIAAQLTARRDQIERAMSRPTVVGRPADDLVKACVGRPYASWADFKPCLDAIQVPPMDAGAIKFASLAPVPPRKTSWLVPAWYVNESTGNNNNTCVSSGSPCHDWDEVMDRWQTTEPILLQATTANFQTNISRTVVFKPIIGPGGSFQVLGASATTLSGTLGTVTAKDRTRVMTACPGASCPFLQATWSGITGAHQGLLLVDSTHSGVGWVDSISGGVAVITQPFQLNVPGFVTFPNEVDTFTTGDAFTLQTPIKFNAGFVFDPTIAVGDSGGDAYFADMGRVWVGDPTATPGLSYVQISRLVRVTESRIDGYYSPSSTSGGFDGTLQNVWMPAPSAPLSADIQGGGYGALTGGGAFLVSGIVDGDVIFDTGVIIQQEVTNVANLIGYVGFNNVTSGGGVQVDGDTAIVGDAYGGNGVIYGKYALDAFNTSASIGYLTTAGATFLGSPTLECQLAAFAQATDLTVAPTWPAVRALSPSALDTAVASGGFGGVAKCDSGATYHVLTQTSSAPSNLCGAGNFMTGNPSSPCAVPPGTGSAVSSVSASGAGLTCSPTTGAVVCSNTGVTSVTAGSGITVSPTTGAVGVGITAPIPVSIGGTGTTSLTNAFSQTHSVLIGEGTSPVGYAGPAVAGFPLLSAGATTDPSFGTLTVGGGGTSVTTLTSHAVVVGEGTSAVAGAGPGTTGQPLLSGGASADPAYGTLGANFGGTGQTSLTSNAIILGSGTSPVSFLTPAIADTVVGTTNGTTWSSFLPLPITSFAGGGAVNLTSAATYFSLASFSDTSTPTRTYSFIGNLSCSNAAAVRIKYGISVNSTSANTVELTMDIQGGTTEFNTGGINFAVATSGSNTFRFLAQDTTTVSSTCNGYLTMVKTVQ